MSFNNESNSNQQPQQQQQQQQQQAQQQQQQQQQQYDQPRFYNSPMGVPQPYLQMNHQIHQIPLPINQSIPPINHYPINPLYQQASHSQQQPQQSIYDQPQQQQPQQQQQQQQTQSQSQTQPVPTNYLLIPNNNYTNYQQQPSTNSKSIKDGDTSSIIEKLQELLPVPPLAKAPIRPDINLTTNQKRAKRKSKFTQRQDELIVSLKRKGKSWVEIAEITEVGSYLAARNRYQVIVGQQGNNNSSSWNQEDKVLLKKILDSAEIEKWQFIANEFNKATGKNYTDVDCRDFIKLLFWMNPLNFQINEDTLIECEKEHKITEKALESDMKKSNEINYAESLLKSNESSKKSSPNDKKSPLINNYYNNYETINKRFY